MNTIQVLLILVLHLCYTNTFALSTSTKTGKQYIDLFVSPPMLNTASTFNFFFVAINASIKIKKKEEMQVAVKIYRALCSKILILPFSLNRPSEPIQSLSFNVRMSSVCAIPENPLPG